MVPFFFVVKVKGWIGYDDALDTFGVHAVGGTMGALLTGFLAVPATLADGKVNPDAVNGNMAANMDKFINAHSLWLEQLKAMGLTVLLAVVATAVLAFALKAIMGLRPSEEVEDTGLDISEHGEEGYHDVATGGYGHVTEGSWIGLRSDGRAGQPGRHAAGVVTRRAS